MRIRINLIIVAILIIVNAFPCFIYGQDILSIDDCIEIALKHNSLYRNTKERENIAKSQVLSSYSPILPKMNFGVNGNHSYSGPYTSEYQTPVYQYDNDGKPVLDSQGNQVVEKYVKTLSKSEPHSNNAYSAGVSFNQLIYDGGRWWNRIRSQNSNLSARSYDTELSRLNTITLVKQSYYELLKAQNQLIVYKEAIKLAEEQLKRSESRYEVGSVAEIDVLSSQVDLNEQKINLLSQQRAVEEARNNLNTVMGQGINEPLMIYEDSTVTPFSKSIEDVLRLAERSNLSIKTAEVEVTRSRLQYKIAKGSLLPTINANFGYSRSNPNFDLIYQTLNQNYSWRYGLSLSLPIFDGFKTKSDIQSSHSNVKITEENVVDAKRNVLKNVKNYYVELVNNLDLIKMLKVNLIAAEKNVELAQERYSVGAGTLLETITARVQYTTARIWLVRAIYDVKIARAKLEGAVGVEEID